MQRRPAFGSRQGSHHSFSRWARRAWAVTGLLGAMLVPAAQATNHLLRMDEIMAALEGDPTIQFIEIVTSGNSQKDWGPQAGETESRAMLVFFDGGGNQTAVFKFPNDPPNGGNTVLIATAAFTARTGLRADITMPPLLNPGSGKVCFRGNPANPSSFSVNLCLSYGNFPAGLTEGAGPPAPALPIDGQPTSLARFQNFAFGDSTSRNGDFILGSPSPMNTSGQTINFPVPGPEISVAPAVVAFGNRDVAVGPASPRPITITSLGSSNALTISSVTLFGPNADQFRILSDSGQTVLGPNSNRVVTIEFDPTTAGAKTATLRIASNDSDEPTVDVVLQGGGIDTNPCAAPDPTVAVAQDVCSQAQLIGPAITYTGNFADANSDGFSSCVAPGAVDVWFRYVASSNGALVVSASANVNQSVGLSAHSGCPGTTANQLACVSPLTTAMQQRFQLNVSAGAELFLRLARFGGDGPAAGGPPIAFQLSLAGPAAFNFDKNRNGVNDNCEFDYGDAPAPYPTTLADNGARHRAVTGLFLGRRIDPNTNGIPTATATGDNLDGPANDDDGVTWLAPLIPGQTAALQVVSSGNGMLNAWIDFNADGDWSDAGEQIFTNRAVVAGTNTLSVRVPNNAAVTNRTFARFRLNSTGGLGVTGSALDGEVEDYAIEIDSPAPVALAKTGNVAISEVLAGLNGDSSVQFVELEIGPDASREWGPQSGETNGGAMLLFFDAAGRQTGRFAFPSNAPAGASTVLVATRAFVAQTGLTPDFIMPPELVSAAGKVEFRRHADDSGLPLGVPLSYGGAAYFGTTDGAGPANPEALPIVGARSLHRTSLALLGGSRNNTFVAGAPTPRNAAGQTVRLTAAPLVEQGRTLFSRETFSGNGRTCLTCHRPGKDQFGLTPATIASLPEDDPLFVLERNVNVLRLAGWSQPGDLRGPIRGTTGAAQILAGSGDMYLVLGGGQLSGVIADTNGNSGQHLDFTLGDLEGPNPSNGSERGLEDHELLRHGRGLILENIDGFTRREVFRASPHLLNVAQTAPYGLSGEFANLRDFAAGAVAQHFPRSLARVSGTDFREPTGEELQALEAFMNSIVTPANGDLSLDRFVTTEAQKRGRALFFGNEAKCAKCHSGPTLSQSDGSLPGSLAGVNESFDTGVANLAINGPDGSNLPTEPAGLGRSTRKFSTPPLFGIRLTAPYFHDGSATNLRAAVEFYDEADFVSSPAGSLAAPMPAVNDQAKVSDLVAFLESLVEIPVLFTREAAFGIHCVGGPTPRVITISVMNTGTNVLVLTNLAFVGPNAGDFRIVDDSGQTSLPAWNARQIDIEFAPASQGSKRATLEFAAAAPDIPGAIRFATSLSGAWVDNVVTAGPAALEFEGRAIDDPPSAVRFVNVTNTGSGPLEIVRVSVTGTNPGDFRITSDSGGTNLPPGGVRTLGIAFAPQARGARSALLRIESVSCSGAMIEVALSGAATSSLDHFEWAPIASPQGFNTAFPVRISAVDRNGELISDFTNAVSLAATSGRNPTNSSASTIVITELDPGTPDAIEFMNVSSAPVDLSGWQVSIIDQVAITSPLIFTFPTGSVVPPGSLFTLTEGGVGPGVFPSFFGGFNISWIGAFSNLAVQVRSSQGAVVDFATGSPLGSGVFSFPPVPVSEWSGSGFPTPAQDGLTSYQRIGSSDNNSAIDWVIAPVSMGVINSGLSGAFASPPRVIALSLTNTTPFQGGIWTGMLAVQSEAVDVRLSADDGAGHVGRSSLFNVIGTPPTISPLPNLTVFEDTLSPQSSFNVSDAETPASALTVTATSSNATLVTPLGIFLGGTGNVRTIRVQPATNQFGTADITVRVSDGSSSASRDFRLTVQPLNDPPVLLPVGNRTVTERTAVSINVLAIDPDLPNDTLTFTLLQGPAGANIDPASGIIQWFPTEQQGGMNFNFQVNVRDALGQSSTSNFFVNVLKVNNAPTLAPVPPQTVYAGGLLRFINSALDLDIPTNFLTFSLAANVPGVTINPTNGVVTWAPLLSQVGLNVLQPVVRDNGQPPMSATQAVSVLVLQPPMSFTPQVDFGVTCANAPLPAPISIGITNIGATSLLGLSVQFDGTDLAEFPILSDTGQTNLAPGAVRLIQVFFLPLGLGPKRATFTLSATAADPPGSFSFTGLLVGAFVDNTVAANVTGIDFGARSIDQPQSSPQTIAITNLGLGPLEINVLRLSITNQLEFILISDTDENPLPPGGTRQWEFAFFPRSRGAKSARLELETIACNNAHVEFLLAGVGTSTLDHFAWGPIAATQAVNAPFPVRLTAQDRNNQTVTEFAGPAALSAVVALPTPPPRIVISEIDPGTPDAVEFVNVSGTDQNLAGWQVLLYDEVSFPSPIAVVPLLGTVPSNGVFTVTESGTGPGQFPNFFAGVNLFWHGASTNIAVLLRDNVNNIVDFATTGDRTRITFPFNIQTNQWSGPGIPAQAIDEVSSYHRFGVSDHNDLSDWTLDARGIGSLRAGLAVPFPTNRILASFPAATGRFTNGVWAGSVGVLEEAAQVRLRADDGNAHVTASDSFVVRGAPPFLSDIPDQTLDEDTATQVIQFSVSDAEHVAGALAVSAVSSNASVVANSGLILGGAGSNRTLVVVPLMNAFGTSTVTVTVSDGAQTTSKSFQVTVNPVPDPPIIANIGNRQVNELQALNLTVTASDADPGSRLTFTLLAAPAGASINPTNGNFTWTPTEAQGPTNALIVVRVADDGFPSLSATQLFSVIVFEVNQPPVFPSISNRVVHVGNVLNFTLVATDPDIPTNQIFFSLIQAPPGASVDSVGGRFTFAPVPSQAGSNFLVRVRATDTGSPSLAATQSFNILVFALPVSQPAPVDFGSNCLVAFPLPTRTVSFTNISTNPVTVASLTLTGGSTNQFFLANDTGETVLQPGQSRSVRVGFNPSSAGSSLAGLLFSGVQQQGTFTAQVSLTGILLDNVASVAPTALDFGNWDIDMIFSPTQLVTLTNSGSVNLADIRVRFSAGDTNDFFVTSDTGPPNVPPGGTRSFLIAFGPTRRGPRAATLTVESAACFGATLNVALTGTGTSGLHHFLWDPVPSPQSPGASFAVRVRAVDRNDEPVTNFSGSVRLSAFGTTDLLPVQPVLLTEIDIGIEAVEFMNVSGRAVDLSGWRVLLYEIPAAPVADFTIPPGSILDSNALFTVRELGTAPGVFPNLFTGTDVNWLPNSTNLSVVLLDAEGGVVDFATLGSSAAITNPVTIPPAHWRGGGIPANAVVSSTSYQRQGVNDRNDSSDWTIALRSFGSHNANLAPVFLSQNTNSPVRVTPTNSMGFVSGRWSGTVTLLDEAHGVRLVADDGAGHVGLSDGVDVFGQRPSISDIADRTVDEDTVVPTMTFTVADDLVPATNLVVFARSSNTNFLPDSRIVVLGGASLRGLRITPATNQFGSAIITVTISDGAQTNSDTFLLTVRPINDPPVMQLGAGFGEGFRENFDNVTRPALPAGWTGTSTAGIQWQTVSNLFDTPPNSVFLPDLSFSSDSSLTSPPIPLGAAPTNLTFRHSFSTESCCDGGFLEASVNGAAFSNVTALGWSFTAGGYNGFSSWRGSSGGFITTTLALPPGLANQSVRFRWRFTSDSSVPGPGWFIDSIAAIGTSSTNRTANEDEPITITVPVSDAETPAGSLVLNVTSSNPTLVPPANIRLGGSDSVRLVTVVPATNQSGSANLTLTLSDGQLTVTQVVSLTFLPVNDPPVIDPVPDQFIDEGSTLMVRLHATDAEQGTNQLTFSATSMPGGASLDPVSGVITWTPDEFQGPGFSTFFVGVSDNGSPPQTASLTFLVFVREVNSAPVITPVPPATTYPGGLVAPRFFATDPDVPPNTVRFSLLSPPAGATIQPLTGQFNWSPGVEHIGTNQITVQATDDGVPPLSATFPFTVHVLPGPAFHSIRVVGNAVVLFWHSIPGLKYRVQFSDQLDSLAWTDIPEDVTASSSLSTKVDTSPSPTQRFYRIQFVP